MTLGRIRKQDANGRRASLGGRMVIVPGATPVPEGGSVPRRVHAPVFCATRHGAGQTGQTLATARADARADAQAPGHFEQVPPAPVPPGSGGSPAVEEATGVCAEDGPCEGDASRNLVTEDELADIVPEEGDIIITYGWRIDYAHAAWDPSQGTASDDSSGSADRKDDPSRLRDYLAKITTMEPREGADIKGVVRYASEGVPSSSHPMCAAKPEWNVFEGEEHDVFFGFTKTRGNIVRSLRHSNVTEVGTAEHVIWKPMSDDELQAVEESARQLGTASRQPQEKDTLAKDVMHLREVVQKMQGEIERLREERALSPGQTAAKPPVSVPPCVEIFRGFASHAIHSRLKCPAKAKPTSKVGSAARSDRGDEHGLDVVPSAVLPFHNGSEGISFTLNHFRQLCDHVCDGLRSVKEDTLSSLGGRIAIEPDQYSMRWDPLGKEFKMRFASYGDFCEACNVHESVRQVRLWPSYQPSVGQDVACLVGTQIVLREDATAGSSGTGRARRIVLLGHSWSRLLQRDESCSLDWLVDCLVQDSVEYIESSDTCPSVFEYRRLRVSELQRRVREGHIVSETVSSSFDMVWTAMPPPENLPHVEDCILGQVTLEMPIVVVRTKALVRSALRFVDASDSAGAGSSTEAENVARVAEARQLRVQATRPPVTTSSTLRADIAPDVDVEGNTP